MKKVVWVFSLSVMLFTQLMTPFAYATGDVTPVEKVVVEKLVTPVEDTASEDEVTIWDDVAVAPEEKWQPEADFSEGKCDKSNLIEQQWISWNNAQIGSWSNEDNNDAAPVVVHSWVTVEANSWDITKLLWNNENLKEEQVEEKIGNWSWEESKPWFLESIKNFLWLWESKEEGKEQKDYEYETKVITWEAEYDDVKVEVYADTWLFYSWTELVIQAVTGDMYEWVKEVLSWQLENISEEEQTVVAFDISFIYSWEEVQPLTWTVQVMFNYENNENLKAAEENDEQEVKVYHLNDKDDEWEKIEEITWAKVENVIIIEKTSDEENKIVVEAENFSIYAIIKSNLSENITVIYDANWWKFKSWNNLLEEISVTYIKQNDWNYIPNVNLQAPNMNNYMFAWWYTTASNQDIEWLGQVGDTTENSIRVYAKWLRFYDRVITLSWVTFTMMDRNLWATDTYGRNDNSYGYYYQWWNNFWFKNGQAYSYIRSQISNNTYGLPVWWPWNYYSNSIFIDIWNNNVNWDIEGNGNLWWGENIRNPDSDRQWPCPEWYHVPDRYERDYALKLFFTHRKNNQNYCYSSYKPLECLFYNLNIPWAGNRYSPTSTDIPNRYSFMYWSSTPASKENAYYFDAYRSADSEDVISSYGRWNWNPIRCFKNSQEDDMYKLIYSWDNWTDDIIYNIRWWEPITIEHKPEDPTNGSLWFLWWYLYENWKYWKLFDFKNEIRINKDTIIKAMWGEKNPIYTYDANGWYFENWETSITVEHTINDWYYERNLNFKIPNRTWYMFAWWYTTSWDWNFKNQNEEWLWQANCRVQETWKIYAKWLPFEDLTLTFSWISFTIMDRNLWAEEVALGTYPKSENEVEDLKKIWFYYQRWNNYWFKNIKSHQKISDNLVDVTDLGPSNYYSSTFVSPTRWNLWNSGNNVNLRWGEYPFNLDENRQWPCPQGYHVPDILEWEMVSNLWLGQLKFEDCELDYRKCLHLKLQLPYMWYYAPDRRFPYYFNSAYWSTSVADNNLESIKVNWTSSRYWSAYWLPVRCFKDTKNEDMVSLTFSWDNWTDDVVYNMRWWEPVTEQYIPNPPVKDGYSFLWWYICENGECWESFNFTEWRILNKSVLLKAKWWQPTQMIEYDANSWVFNNWSQKLLISHQIISWSYIREQNIGIPNRTWYMFAWWFVESWDYLRQTTEWEMGRNPVVEKTKKVYAKWLPFNDLTLTMSWVTFTIMDRNLWASAYMNENGKNQIDWNGYYYQWWNNYWFKNSWYLKYFDNERIDADIYDETWWYYSNIFKNIGSSPERWTINNNKNLWWWWKEKSWDIDKQWPCPVGYHIPDQNEWLSVINIFKSQENLDSDFCDGTLSEGDCFSSKLKLPYAWYRNYQWILHNGSSYWSSTPRYDYWAFYLYLNQYSSLSDQSYNASNRVRADPIRCFKNSAKIVYHSNYWTVPTFPTNVSKSWEKPVKLPKLLIPWYTFWWWYKTIDFVDLTEVYDNNLIIDDDFVDIYAKWDKNPWYLYNANWGSFSWEKVKTIMYNSSLPLKVSHTPNLDDDWNKLSEYADYLDINDVVTISWAEKLHIVITYWWENCCDYVAMWTWAHPEYSVNNYNDVQKSFLWNNWTLWWWNHNNPDNIKEYYVSWDTVTIAYKSDWSSHWDDWYWYYAIISNPDAGNEILYYTDEDIPIPQRTWYSFTWWYETWTIEPFDIVWTEITQDRLLYAKRIPNSYVINFNSNNWEDLIVSQTHVYDLQQKLTWNIFTFSWYSFQWWNTEIEWLWTWYFDRQEVVNLTWDNNWIIELYAQWRKLINVSFMNWDQLLTWYEVLVWDKIPLPEAPKRDWYTFTWWLWLPIDWIAPDADLVLTAWWSLIPPSAWWWSNTNNQPTEKDHKSAELTWTTKELEVEQVKQQPTKTNTNTPKESIKQESATQSTTSQSQIDSEIHTAYEWAKSKDITTIQTLDEAMPDGVVKRWHLAKMVVNYATNILWREIPEKIPSECRWNDNRKDWESEEIKDYAVKSCALWLMWLDMPKFLPNLEVTRAQFGTIMSRLLWWKKYAWWTPYYRKHLNALKENNIMTQLENPERRVELRQWVWVMLMRSAENK